MKQTILFIGLTIFISSICFSQVSSDTSKSKISTEINEGVQFQATLPILNAVPGGRLPFYTYLWDFGDGHFSTLESPIHNYRSPGNYVARLYATNNYDMGTKPPRPIKNIQIDAMQQMALVSVTEATFFGDDQIFRLNKNADALPGSDIVLTAGVKPQTSKGTIYILSNEKIFKNPGFIFKNQSTYNSETLLDPKQNEVQFATLAPIEKVSSSHSGSPNYGPTQLKILANGTSVDYFKKLFSSYQSVTAYEIGGNKETPQFSFINLDIAEGMLKDTNAIVTITGIYIPEGSSEAFIHQLDIPIVASHDPNKMLLKQTRMAYRKVSKKKIFNYKVQFQNDGEGDAKNIRLEMALPKELDTKTFTLSSLYPQCPPCSELLSSGCWEAVPKGEDSLFFYFKEIRLPGSKAPDRVDYDSSKGYVRFEIMAGKKLPNKVYAGRTGIFFDKNEPVITNFTNAKFRKSLSPILIAGYNFVLGKNLKNQDDLPITYSNSYQIGIGLAPIAPYKRIFWQVELYANHYESQTNQFGIKKQGELIIDSTAYIYNEYDYFQKCSNLRLGLAVIPLKYNINQFFSMGIGLESTIEFNLKNTETEQYQLNKGSLSRSYVKQISTSLDHLKPISFRPFVDLNVGKVYLGPSLGIRYLYGINSYSALFTYVRWSF